MKRYFIFSLVISAVFITSMTAFGQGQLIFVETSQNAYEEGDTIVVSGNVTSIIAGEQVSLTIFREGNLVDIAQIEVAQDGNFATTFKVHYGIRMENTLLEHYMQRQQLKQVLNFIVNRH